MIVFLPRSLDAQGRCCGRKPIFYKTHRMAKSLKDPRHFCATCSAEYTPDGQQRANFAWKSVPGGFVPANTDGLNFKAEDWTEFFAVDPSQRSKWKFHREMENARRSA